MSGKKLLEIRELHVRFGKDPQGSSAVHGVSLNVREGSFAALVGESGSGKSVTAMSVCRLVHPNYLNGSIVWHGGEGPV